MMNHKTTRTWTAILAAALALSLLLTACGNGGDTPTGENTTPGVSDTPDNTPSGENTYTPDTSEPTGEPEPTPGETTDPTTRPTRPVVILEYDEEKKAIVDEEFAIAQNLCDKYNINVDLDDAIKGAFDDYWEFFDERVTYEAFRTAVSYLIPGIIGGENLDENNISKIESASFEKASDFVVNQGGKALDITDPKQNFAALAIATTLNFQTNVLGMNDSVLDLGASFDFGLTDGKESMGFKSIFSSFYYVIVE